MGSLKDVPLSNGEQRSRDQLHHFLYPQQRHQNQQHQENTSSRCLLTAAVQLIDGAHNNGAPPHLRSKWNRIRERLGRIQTAGAENKQRRSSQVLGAAPIPSSSLTSRSNSATASAAKATASHGPLSLPLPVPQGSVPSTSASINCIGSLNQQPSDPLVLCQASGRQSSSRKVYPDAPSPFPLYSRSNSSSSSSSTVTAAPPGGPVLELEDWPGASQQPTSAYSDMHGQGSRASTETRRDEGGLFSPSPPPEAPAARSAQPQQLQPYSLSLASGNLAHLQQQQQLQQASVMLPMPAQASTPRPPMRSPRPVVSPIPEARSCPLPGVAAPAAAAAAAGTAAARAAAGAAAAAKPPAAALAACVSGLEGGAALAQAGGMCAGLRLPAKPLTSRLARSHTYTGALNREGGCDSSAGSDNNNEEDSDGGVSCSAPTLHAAATPPMTIPRTPRATNRLEQHHPLPLQPQPQHQHHKQPLHQPQQQQQQQPRAPLPLTVQPPRSPPPEDHPAHRIRHRSWSHTQLSLSPSMLQLPSASYPDPPPAAAAPAPAGHPPAASPSEAAPCVQPPPCAVASAPLAPTLRVSHHSHHAISTFSSTHCATTISAPLFPTAAAPPPAAPASRTSSDHLRQRPLFSPQSLPPKRTSMERTSPAPPSSPEAKNTNNSSTCSSGGSSGAKGPAAAASSHPSIAATHYTSPLSPHSGSPQAPQQSATHARLPAHPQQSAPHLQPQTLPAPALGGGSSRDAAMGRRHPLSLLLHGSSCMEQEPLRNAETHKAPRGPSLAKKAAGLARLPARLPSTSPPPAAAYVLPIPSITPAHPGAKAEIKQTLRADRACAQASALRKVASACELSGPVLAPAGSIGSGAESSTNERMRGARGGAPAASSSSSPFQLHSGKSSIGKAVSLWDSSCEQCGFSSSNSSSSCCIKCGADTLSAKAHRPSGTLHGALSGSRSSSAGTPTPSTLSCTLSSSIPSHLSRSSSNTTTSSSSTSNSFKEPPASAVAAPLEHAGLRHSLSTDVPEGMYAMMEPAYSGLASVPEAELEWAEDSGVGSEGGAAGAGPEGSLRPEQQQHKPKEAMARGRLGARLLASLRAVGSMANHAH